jgi:hypothetical protein
MHLSLYAAAALVAGGLQASALPTSEGSSIDLELPGQAELSKLDERAIDWWPATNCVRHFLNPRIDPQHKLTYPPTDRMYRDVLGRQRNRRLVVRRHQNDPTESGHDVLDVSFCQKAPCLITQISVVAHCCFLAAVALHASTEASASLRSTEPSTGRHCRWSRPITSRHRCFFRWGRMG